LKRSSIFKNLFSLGIIQILNLLMPMVTFPIISRIIGPSNFGVIQYCSAFVVYFNLFIGYGFNLTATRRISKDPHNQDLRSKVFNEVFYSQVLLGLFSLVVLLILSFSIPTLKSNINVAFFSFLFLVSTILTQNWMFQAMQDLSKVAMLNVLGKIIYFVLVITLVTSKDLYYWQPLALSITQIFISFISFIWALKIYDIALIQFKLRACLTLLWEERFVFLTQSFNSGYVTLNIILLGFFVSSEDLGYYSASQKLVLIFIQLITMPLSQVLFPIISRSFAKSKVLGISQIQRVIPIITLGVTAFCVFLFVCSDYVLILFYGEGFRESLRLFKILAIVPLITSVNNTIGVQVFLNLGFDNLYFNIMVFVTFLSFLLNFIFTNGFGIEGTAISWLLTESILLILLVIFSIRFDIKLINWALFLPKEVVRSLRTIFSR